MTITIHPTSVVEPGARLDEGVTIGPFCYVGASAELGAGTRLISHATVLGNTRLGKNCTLHPHAALGDVPQVIGMKEQPDSRLEIGDNCEFREYATAHSGMPKFGASRRSATIATS